MRPACGTGILKISYILVMSKTKMVVKEDQIMVDVEMIFKEIEAAGGDWKKVREEFMNYLKELKVDTGEK